MPSAKKAPGKHPDDFALNTETEIKFEPPAGFKMPEIPGEPLPTRTFVSSYFDTDDMRLGRLG